jgi:hypothetical protein
MWIVGHFDCHSIIISRNQGIKFLQLLIIWDHTWYNNLYLIVKNPQELVSRKSQSTPELNHDLICKNGVVKKDDPIELLSERVIGREAAGEIPERERERERDGDDGGGAAAIWEFYGKISVSDHN